MEECERGGDPGLSVMANEYCAIVWTRHQGITGPLLQEGRCLCGWGWGARREETKRSEGKKRKPVE